MKRTLQAMFQPAAESRVSARSWRLTAAVVALVLVAFALRVYAVRWGLPYVEHPDEPSAANKVLNMIRRGDWNPRFFEKPSLYYYLLRLVFAAHLRYGIATGLYRDMAQLPLTTDRYLTTPELFVWGRMLSVVLGAATVAVLYLAGRRWWGARVGLVAAAFLAVSPFHMRESQYITVDVTTTFMTLIALAAALRLLDQSGWRAYALAGFTAGLAASTKYNAGAVVLSIAVAHLMVWGRASLRRIGRLAWAGLASLLGFVLATPYSALTFESFIDGIRRQQESYGPATQGGASHTWPLLEYLQFFRTDGLHPLPFLAALAGICIVVARRSRAGLIMLVFVLSQVVFFLAQNRHFPRNLLVIIPPLALYAALAIDAAASALARSVSRATAFTTKAQTTQTLSGLRAFVVKLFRYFGPTVPRSWASSLIAAALTAVVLSGPLLDAVAFTRFEARLHSKVRAGNYLREHLPRGAPIAVALNPVQWGGQPFVTPVDDIAAHTAAWYRAQGYRYLIANAKETDRPAYQALRAEARVLEVFPGDQDGQPGPRMELLDLGDRPEALAIERRAGDFGGKLALLGFQRGAGALRDTFRPVSGSADVPRGQALEITLYWRALAPIAADYAIFLHLLDERGQTVAQRDTLIRAADYPTSRWRPGELALDMADLPIPATLAPGSYRLDMGVYRMDTFERLPLVDTADGALKLMTVIVK